ncbi:MAG: Nif3-like dinuclear metal center hexameric protein [Candidatus Latescibacterota bacterium]
MVIVRDVVEVMEQWAPSALAETWDNPGLMTGNLDTAVSAVLVSLDVNTATLQAARSNRANLIVSHHPPIFKPLYSLAGSSPAVLVIQAAIRGNFAIYSSHTNLDQAPGGVSFAAAERLGLRSIAPLAPGRSEQVKFVTFTPPEFTGRVREAAGSAGAGSIGEYRLCSFTVRGTGSYIPSAEARPFEGKSGLLTLTEEDRIEMIAPASSIQRIISAVRAVHPYEEMAYDIIPLANTDSRYGYGGIGMLEEPMSGRDFLSHAAGSFGIAQPSFSGPLDREVRRVAVMSGSGGKYFSRAISMGADALVTGDVGYHDFLEADESILLVDATHRATELPVLDAIKRRLSENLPEPIDIVIDLGAALPAYGLRGSPI